MKKLFYALLILQLGVSASLASEEQKGKETQTEEIMIESSDDSDSDDIMSNVAKIDDLESSSIASKTSQPSSRFFNLLLKQFTLDGVRFLYKDIQLKYGETSGLRTDPNSLSSQLANKFGGEWTVVPFKDDAQKRIIAGLLLYDNKGNVIISYPGTETEVLKNVTLKMAKFNTMDQKYFAHQGFFNFFNASWNTLYKLLKNYAGSIKKNLSDLNIVISGYSRGGASAMLTALRLATKENVKTIKVVTFGSPKVFAANTAKQYNKLLGEHSLRVVITNAQMKKSPKVSIKSRDRVPTLPPGFGFTHVGVEFPLIYTSEVYDTLEHVKFKSLFGTHGYYSKALHQYQESHGSSTFDSQLTKLLNEFKSKLPSTSVQTKKQKSIFPSSVSSPSDDPIMASLGDEYDD